LPGKSCKVRLASEILRALASAFAVFSSRISFSSCLHTAYLGKVVALQQELPHYLPTSNAWCCTPRPSLREVPDSPAQSTFGTHLASSFQLVSPSISSLSSRAWYSKAASAPMNGGFSVLQPSIRGISHFRKELLELVDRASWLPG